MTKTPFPTENVTLKNVEILRTPFRNFSGSPTKLNPEGGKRYFNIRLDEETAKRLEDEGWHVKTLPPRDAESEPLYLLELKINYKGRPPRIVKVTPTGKEPLTEEVLSALDAADIEFANVIFRPYNWGGPKPSAYVQTLFVHIRLDELEQMYETENEDEVICDEDGVCYINGVRIND